MAENIASWESKITPHVKQLAYPALIGAVRATAIDFCKRTHIWKEDLDRIDVVADETYVTLTPPEGGQIWAVENVKYKADGADDDQFTNLNPYSEIQADLHQSASWKFQTASSPNGYYLKNDRTKLYFYLIPTEDSDEGLLVKAVLIPTKTCTTLPDLLWDDWDEAIAHGAKAKLLSQEAQPWFDAGASTAWSIAYEEKVSDAKWHRYTGATNRQPSVRMREWL